MKAWSPCGPFLEAAGRSSEVYFCQSWQHPENQLVDRWQTKAFQSCLAQEKEPFEELLNLTWPSAQAFYQLFKSSDEIFEILKKQDLVLGCLLAWHKTTQEVNIENKKTNSVYQFFQFHICVFTVFYLKMTACCHSPSSNRPMRSCRSPLSRCQSTTRTPPSLHFCWLRVCRPWRRYWPTYRWQE